jgi:hypothetical protein
MPSPIGTIPGPGRPKGAANKATLDARRAIADFVEGNVERLNGWLDAIAEENPMAAFDRFMSVVEFHIPRLARQEVTGKDGERLQINIMGLEAVPERAAIDAEFKEVVDVEAKPLAIESATNE